MKLSLHIYSPVYPPQGISSRIVGGKDAEDGSAPFQCSLQSSKRHFCGCSIISKDWIVTASHCVFGYFKKNIIFIYFSSNQSQSTRNFNTSIDNQ